MGTSTPVLVGSRLFVTAEPDLLICLDPGPGRNCGARRTRLADFPAALKPKNPRRGASTATPTPLPSAMAHGSGTCYGTGIVACYDLDGKPAGRVV